MMMCYAEKISKRWGGTLVFEQLSLEIQDGERIGLVGPNGCGKSTVLKLLSGMEPPDSGMIHYKKGSRTAMLAQIPDYGPDITALEVLELAFAELLRLKRRMTELESEMASPDPNTMEKTLNEYGTLQHTFATMGGYEMEANRSRVADGLGIKHLLQMPFDRLSGGERTKVCLGRILLEGPDLLLLDEPTNHLDLSAVEWLETYLQDYRGSVLIVSHDRYFLDRVVTKVYDLEGGAVDIYHGNYSYFVEEKERRLLLDFAAFQEQQKKIRKMEEAIKRMRLWAAQADNPLMFKRAAAMQKALDRMNKLDRPVLERKKMGLTFEMSERSGKDVVRMEGVSKSFGSSGEAAELTNDSGGGLDRGGDRREGRALYANVDLHVRFGEAVAIVGDNGSGKSTLLRMILGQLQPDSGTVTVGSQVKIGYLAQRDWFPDEEKTIVDAFRDMVMVEEGEARHLLAKFLFYGASVYRKVNALSGGERMRLRLAQLMHQEMNALVLDEPTNHLDIDAREALEDTLAAFPGTLICVSHDRYLLNKLFPVTYWLEDGALTRYEGGYNDAKRKRGELRSGRQAAALASKDGKTLAAAGKNGGGREESRSGGRRSADDHGKLLADLEVDIASMERKLAVLDEAMMAETEPKKLAELHGEKQLLEAERELLYQRLEQAES
ncbi:ribosomal protection-like ABC-F family protein [Paenibacillus oceani]|uniref:ABC-F family ATP-binding cassette domain-containing protein n=1 Tax=Paenibacillus oceani TaxID=2772510 RepID=A0A927C6T7_9BACL|nr:ABC-F family ATP-binding cassette domain-containing protein [Paenibacillus oceani]MBD2860796.1 ABC-F family ATP-binding cassette domain-containing protein [Paenibacillus oceani]